MKMIMRLVFISTWMIVASPASASALQVYYCEQGEETSDDKILAMASEWLKAAKEMKGGENLEMYINFPVAAQAGETDFTMLIVAPSFAEWGSITDAYAGSATEEIDDKYKDDFECSKSTLWESEKVE